MVQQEIPNTYHFIWLGAPVPYFLALAMQSALLRCKDSRVKLWIDEERRSDPMLEQFNHKPRFETALIDVEQLVENLHDEPVKKKLKAIFNKAGTKTLHENRKPVERAQSNLLRYLILYQEGGIYLDADTLVTNDLAPLRKKNSGFIGKENSIWAITRRKNPLHYFIWAPFLELYRMAAILLPFGYRMNNSFRVLCSSSENNAVMGMTPRHHFLKACFAYILTMTDEEIVLPLRLGPFLLQRVAQQYHGHDLDVYPEPYFYPYGPMISQHFFRERMNAAPVAAYMLKGHNYVIHWGASTKVLKSYTKESILQQPDKSVFSLLASAVIADYEKEH